MKKYVSVIIAVAICTSAFAGDKGQQEDWMKQAREKETRRAKEAAEYNGNIEHMEKKYGWLKKDHPQKYEAMIAKRKLASKMWGDIAGKISSAETYEDIQALKTPAYKVEADAEITRLELKAAAAEKDWKHSAEKTGSPAVAEIAKKLIKNQSLMLDLTRSKMGAEQKLRELETQRKNLEKQMRTEYEKAKKAMHSRKSGK